jgi:hypothetical protein
MNKCVQKQNLFMVRILIIIFSIMGILLITSTGNVAFAQSSAANAPPKLTAQQLEKLVAPIALYPDSLVSQILPASTLSIQIVEANRYLQKNGGKVVGNPPSGWDPSIQALLSFPDVIKKMDADLTWTQNLGDAVIFQTDDVIAAVQSFRRKAYDAKNLKTTPQQTVEVQKETIIIQPADPEVIYVPEYNPEQVIVQQPYAVVSPAPLVGFATGVALTNWAYANSINWYDRNIMVNPAYRYGVATPYTANAYARGYVRGATSPYAWKPTPVARANVRSYNYNPATYKRTNVNNVNRVNVNNVNRTNVNRTNVNNVNRTNVNNVNRNNVNNANRLNNTSRTNRDAFSGMSSGSSARTYSSRGASSYSGRSSGAVRGGGGRRR